MKSIAPVFISMMAIGATAYTEGTPTSTYSPVITESGCPAKYDPTCPYFCNGRGQGSFCSPNFITGPGTPGCYVCPGIPSECPSTPNDSCAYICTGSEDINLGPGSPNVFCAPSDASLGPLGDSTTKAISCVPCSDDESPVVPPPPEDTTTPTVPLPQRIRLHLLSLLPQIIRLHLLFPSLGRYNYIYYPSSLRKYDYTDYSSTVKQYDYGSATTRVHWRSLARFYWWSRDFWTCCYRFI
ncbi:uncharacterized protein DFL_007428 [Arthrobotrys flagrans]|uniref:Tyrosine-protein kinase ephrin type A/B receptor-like domain-containing protein n=1 Tax=Arthrobotrys flagrans TaxID=97331 RepID=A0A436ZVM6_ARTFL|nr:hypothetical protein DFL_007428 [Arthrobotrys flagrans]